MTQGEVTCRSTSFMLVLIKSWRGRWRWVVRKKKNQKYYPDQQILGSLTDREHPKNPPNVRIREWGQPPCSFTLSFGFFPVSSCVKGSGDCNWIKSDETKRYYSCFRLPLLSETKQNWSFCQPIKDRRFHSHIRALEKIKMTVEVFRLGLGLVISGFLLKLTDTKKWILIG